jgi:dCMP deaminase
MTNEKWDLRFIDLAKHISTWSKDPSTQVGAVLVSPDRTDIIMGYNGFPRNMNDDISLYANRDTKLSRVIHAELNAILLANKSVNGYTLYLWPFISCDRCAVHVIQAGINRVVCPLPNKDQLDRWKDSFDMSLSYFKEANVEVQQYDLKNKEVKQLENKEKEI